MRNDVREELWCSRSTRLKGKHVLFTITGSVSIYKVPDMIRELIREGAEVQVMLSPEAERLITPSLFEWATGKPVHTEITGNVEHVLLVGDHSEKVDLVVCAPVSANTLGKLANGIADSNVSLTLMTAAGNRVPILMVPGMHEPMFRNPAVQRNIQTLKSFPEVVVLDPRVEEGKAKLPTTQNVVHWALRLLTPQSLAGKHVLVTGGPTREYVDQVRFLSNPSSGKMGWSLAQEAWYRGAEVTFVVGPNSLPEMTGVAVRPVTSAAEMLDAVEDNLRSHNPSFVVLSSAVADYRPTTHQSEKIRSGNANLSIPLEPTAKIINRVQELRGQLGLSDLHVVGFKAEYNKSLDELVTICGRYLADGRADAMVANQVKGEEIGFAVSTSEVFLILPSRSPLTISGSKQLIALQLWDQLVPPP